MQDLWENVHSILFIMARKSIGVPRIWSTRFCYVVFQVFGIDPCPVWASQIANRNQELYADPTKHFTDEELKERDANIKMGEEVGACALKMLGHVGSDRLA